MKKVGKIILFSLLGLVILGTFWFLWEKSRPVITEYEIISPERSTVENKTVATGKVEPRDEILIKPQISGIVSEVMKEAGEKIHAGDIIAKVKVIPEMGQLNSAESRVRVAEINLSQSKLEYDRQLKLFQNGVISKEEFETSETSYKKSKEEKENAQDALDIVKDGISKKFVSISNTQIRSTITGMILDIPIKAGNSVIQANTFNDGTTIASIADMKDLIFRGKVDETEVGRIKEGMPILLTVGALNSKKFDAVLEYIAPKGTEENGAVLFEIKAAVKVPDTAYIRAGYSANAEIVLARVDSVISIPESCVEFSNDSAYVYVLKGSFSGDTLATKSSFFSGHSTGSEQKFDKRNIQIGLSDGIRIEVKKGLTLEDKIRGNPVDKNPNKH